MKVAKSQSLRLLVMPAKKLKYKSTVPDALGCALLALLLYCGVGGTALAMLALPVYSTLMLMLGIGVIGVGCFWLRTTRLRIIGMCGMQVFTMLVWVLRFDHANNGLAIVSNQFTRVISVALLKLSTPFEVPDITLYSNSVTVLLLPVATLLAIGCVLLTRHPNRVAGGALLLFLAVCTMFQGVGAPGLWAAVLAVGVALLFFRSFSGTATVPDRGRQLLLIAGALAAALAVCMAIIAVIPGASDGLEQTLDSRQKQVRQTVHALRYEGGEKNVLPEGDFSAIGAFAPNGETMLELTMERPRSVYLRGFVGGIYTPQGWRPIDGLELYANNGLFNALQSQNFFAQTQLGDAAQLLAPVLGEKARETANLAVQNTAACRAYVYAPYSAFGVEPTLRGDGRLGEATMFSTGWRGQRAYAFTVASGAEAYHDDLAQALESRRNDTEGAIADYVEQEQRYARFAYETYTEITVAQRKLLEPLLGDGGVAGKTHLAYDAARQNVRSALAAQVRYDTGAAPLPKDAGEDDDFVAYLLEDAKSGYSVHYATLATVMMRYYGIPARYVEGYYLSESDAQDIEPNSPYEVSNELAHAWCEYYYDGIGWIPFEATPGYYDPENPEQNSFRQPNVTQENIEQPIPEDDTAKPEEEKDGGGKLSSVLLRVLISLLLFLLVLAVWLMLRRATIERRRRLWRQSNYNLGAAAMMDYLLQCAKRLGMPARGSIYSLAPQFAEQFGAEWRARYREAAAIYQKAVYSRDGIDIEQRDEMRAFVDTFVYAMEQTGSQTQQFLMKYVYWLY